MMPIYEYVCDACGYDFERIQSFNDDPLDTCPECEGAVRRIISPVGIIFKGSGWYITDSKRQLSGSRSLGGGRRQIADDKDGKATDGGDAGEKSEDSTKADTTTKPEAAQSPEPDKSAKGGGSSTD